MFLTWIRKVPLLWSAARAVAKTDVWALEALARVFPRTKAIAKSYLISRYKMGMRPWTLGYVEYRAMVCEKMLGFPLPSIPFGRTLDERIVELPWVFSELSDARKILDAGSALNVDFLLKRLIDKRVYILTLYAEQYRGNSGESYIYEDLRRISFRDDAFDAITCISTIEHIGFDCTGYKGTALRNTDVEPGDRLTVIRELKRVLAPGGRLLLTGPVGGPVDSSRFCNLSRQDVLEFIETFAPSSFEVRYFKYGSCGWTETRGDDQSLDKIEYRGNAAAAAGAVVLIKLIK